MGVLQSFERRLSGLVEGAFAKVFRGGVEPVEIAGALARECDDRKVISARRTLVPNAFVVELSTADAERLTPYAEPLTTELAQLVREHAEEVAYSFAGPVAVRLSLDAELPTGVFRVHAEVSGDGAIAAPLSPAAVPAAVPAAPPLRTSAAPPTSAVLVLSAGGTAAQGSPEAEGAERQYVLMAAVTRIGRAADTDLRLDDTAVSRHHAEVRRLPALSADEVGEGAGPHGQVPREVGHLLVDLGSTNGTTVGGRRISTAQLHDGDRITIGSSTLVYRSGIG